MASRRAIRQRASAKVPLPFRVARVLLSGPNSTTRSMIFFQRSPRISASKIRLWLSGRPRWPSRPRRPLRPHRSRRSRPPIRSRRPRLVTHLQERLKYVYAAHEQRPRNRDVTVELASKTCFIFPPNTYCRCFLAVADSMYAYMIAFSAHPFVCVAAAIHTLAKI